MTRYASTTAWRLVDADVDNANLEVAQLGGADLTNANLPGVSAEGLAACPGSLPPS